MGVRRYVGHVLVRDAHPPLLPADDDLTHRLHIQPVTAGLFYPKRNLSGFQQQLLVGVGKGTAARGVQRLTGKWLNTLNALGSDLLVVLIVFFQCSIVLGGLQGTCRCIRLFCFPLPKARYLRPCAVQPLLGFCQERTQLLPGCFQFSGALAGIHPGGCLG